ncbi:MAG: hypothetical protein WAW88_17035, partial [Nocardioides sp.]
APSDSRTDRAVRFIGEASATARAIAALGTPAVVYVITGDGGRAQEDLACAKHIHALVEGAVPPRRHGRPGEELICGG